MEEFETIVMSTETQCLYILIKRLMILFEIQLSMEKEIILAR